MILRPNTITLRTLDGTEIATLALMGAFKGDPGAGADIYTQVLNLYNQIASSLIPVTRVIADRILTKEHAINLIVSQAETPITLTIRKNTGLAPNYDWQSDSNFATFFSVCQDSAAAVTIVGEDDVEVSAPSGYLPQPRQLNSIVTFTSHTAGKWVCSGDMAFDE